MTIFSEHHQDNNYLLTESEVFTRSIRKDLGLIFYHRDRAVEVNGSICLERGAGKRSGSRVKGAEN